MSFGNTTEDAILNLVFRAQAWANVADNAASAPETNIAMVLHTADPGEAGTAATSEATYTGYARTNVARTTGGWTAPASGAINPAANIDFPAATAGTNTVTFASAAKTGAAGSAAAIYLSGGVSPPLSVTNGVIPRLTTATSLSID